MPNTKNSTVINLSRFISNFFNPIVSLLIYFIYSSIYFFEPGSSVSRFIPILLLIILPIVIWLIWNVKKGNYTNLDVSNRQQRKGFYFFISGVFFLYLGYDYLRNGTLDLVMLFLFILLLALQLSNYFVKSSMHTAFNVYVAALFFFREPVLGFAWLVIAALVGITRVVLGRHTVKEVCMGATIAALVSFIYLYAAIQNFNL